MLATRDLVRDNFSKYQFKNNWKVRSLPEQTVIDSIKDNVKRLMNLPPEQPLFIEPTNYGNYAFEFNYTVGPKDKPEKTGTFTVQLDTGKVVISASKKNPVELLPPDFDIDERSPTDKPPIPRDRLTNPIYRVPKGKN